ncbi:low affinity sulfate transporter 3-like [Impatiens glandulifera]|uniref:low affinity sulfate transporter 3-like n=1 Tax=Impatiens glandulifera TaxID=253017 RepID=UPI001FB0BF83|nr:low affinity sulfate transporter 3-like [Impatiens glandulifera]
MAPEPATNMMTLSGQQAEVTINGGINRETSSKFSQTLQISTMASDSQVAPDVETHQGERAQWVLNAPKPPGVWTQFRTTLRDCVGSCSGLMVSFKKHPFEYLVRSLESVFPIIGWSKDYSLAKFKCDLLAGFTLASLCIPQSIGYATLAKLEPQYGLYTSIVPPLIYAFMGTSREIAIGPVAVISLLLSSTVQKLQDPETNPIAYRNMVFTVTFLAGVFQASFGILRLGFVVDFVSHAAILGFMGGAAIIIGLQQLKGLLGIAHFTTKTDVVSVISAVQKSFHSPNPWNPLNFIIGCSFLIFILTARFIGRRHKKLMFLSVMGPLISVILSTAIVYATRADKHGVNIVKHIKGGLNPSSIHQLDLSTTNFSSVAKIAVLVAIVALTEAMAVGRSFATMKGYHIDGNKEMVAMGFMNVAGSMSSCYMATGSFSRTAVNNSAGCQTAVSNVVMAITVLVCLEAFTRLLYYTPSAILGSIILSALPGLIDLNGAYHVWKVDKLDFLATLGAFFGVLFVSVEIGLLVAVLISFAKIMMNSIQPGIERMGRVPSSSSSGSNAEEDAFGDVKQYPMALDTLPMGVLIFRVKSSLLCFANATSVTSRILKWARYNKDEAKAGENGEGKTKLIILDMSNLVNIDTSGIASLKELHKELAAIDIELAIVNPRWQVIDKLRLANYVNKPGERVFLTVGEAMDACIGSRVLLPPV